MIPQSANHLYRFGPFRLNPAERLLLRDGQPVPVTPKVFDTLVALVEHHGRLLKKDELIGKLWPDATVEEDNLTHNISALRKALGDDRNSARFIETVPRLGYRFVAEVHELSEGEAQPEIESQNTTSEPAEKIPAETAQRRLTNRKAIALLVLALAALGAAIYWSFARPSNDAAAKVRSITIPPFVSRVAGDEYLALGMAETLITRLSQIRQLVVRPTNAYQKYAAGTDPIAIGRRQDVEATLTGELHRVGESVSVKISLLDAKSKTLLWERIFNNRLEAIFELQDSITDHVAGVLGLELTRRERELLSKQPTGDIEAYEAYMKGRLLWNDRGHKELRESFLHFEHAIRKDGRFALGYSGLASAYAFDYQLWPKTEEMARKALELDPTLAEPHATIGFVRMYWEWNWLGAEEEFKQAITINPNFATAHHWYAIFTAVCGGASPAVDLGVEMMKHALALDRFSPAINADLGQLLYFARQYDEAIAACQKALAIDPSFTNANRYLHDIYLKKGMSAEAVEQFFIVAQRPAEVTHSDPTTLKAYRDAYKAEGISGFWRERKKVLSRYPVDAYRLAQCFARLGEKEGALDWLEEAYRSRAFNLVYVKADPVFENLWDEKRFQNLLKRMRM